MKMLLKKHATFIKKRVKIHINFDKCGNNDIIF